MNKTIVAATLVFALIPATGWAQERAGDAALGALSGAVVLGPVGAVAGAVVGFTTGPDIARAWGLKRSAPPRSSRGGKPAATKAPDKGASQPGMTSPAAAQRTAAVPEVQASQAAVAPRPAPANGQSAFPPVQPLE